MALTNQRLQYQSFNYMFYILMLIFRIILTTIKCDIFIHLAMIDLLFITISLSYYCCDLDISQTIKSISPSQYLRVINNIDTLYIIIQQTIYCDINNSF